MSQVISAIMAERQRQQIAEGFDAQHDAEHTGGELALVAACYALTGAGADIGEYDAHTGCFVVDIANNGVCVDHIWPKTWSKSWWKPGDKRRDLVKAAALIVAEIERLDRLTPPVNKPPYYCRHCADEQLCKIQIVDTTTGKDKGHLWHCTKCRESSIGYGDPGEYQGEPASCG